jgi:hypothetical protein
MLSPNVAHSGWMQSSSRGCSRRIPGRSLWVCGRRVVEHRKVLAVFVAAHCECRYLRPVGPQITMESLVKINDGLSNSRALLLDNVTDLPEDPIVHL